MDLSGLDASEVWALRINPYIASNGSCSNSVYFTLYIDQIDYCEY